MHAGLNALYVGCGVVANALDGTSAETALLAKVAGQGQQLA